MIYLFRRQLHPKVSGPSIIEMVELPATYLRNYGVQKFIGEQLVADYTRKGFVRGRSVRLVTVAVRRRHARAACCRRTGPASARRERGD
jgi:nucleoside-diphosphate-sugar epimerase